MFKHSTACPREGEEIATSDSLTGYPQNTLRAYKSPLVYTYWLYLTARRHGRHEGLAFEPQSRPVLPLPRHTPTLFPVIPFYIKKKHDCIL